MTTSGLPFPPCPRCGSTEAIEIVYGYPSSEMGEAEMRGELVLGGCIVGDESPDYLCRDCRAPLPVGADTGRGRRHRRIHASVRGTGDLRVDGSQYRRVATIDRWTACACPGAATSQSSQVSKLATIYGKAEQCREP